MKYSKSTRRRRRDSSRDRRSRHYRSRSRSRSTSSDRDRRRRSTRRSTRSSRDTKTRRLSPEDIKPKIVTPATEPLEIEEELTEEPLSKITHLVKDREKVIEHLFLTFSGSALEELVPEYLKKCTLDELKSMCLEELKKLSEDFVLHIISGKDPSSYPERDSETCSQSSQSALGKKVSQKKSENNSSSVEGVDRKLSSEPDSVTPSPVLSENVSNDSALELYPSTNEIESIIDEENQVPLVSNEELLHGLLPESHADLELLELEMRARAIRSLLKSKVQHISDEEDPNA